MFLSFLLWLCNAFAGGSPADLPEICRRKVTTTLGEGIFLFSADDDVLCHASGGRNCIGSIGRGFFLGLVGLILPHRAGASASSALAQELESG